MRTSIQNLLTLGKIATAAVALVAASSFSASAADMRAPAPVYGKAPAYEAPYFSWAGLYAGVVGGGVWGTSQFVGLPGAVEFDMSGFQFGGTLGYNWQVGRFVYGIEGDLSYSTNSGNVGAVEVTEDFAATIRGRFGYTFSERTLVYATGGYAGANISISGGGATAEKWRNGWTLGAGLEYALKPNWTVKGEYLFVSYMDDVNGLAAPVTNVSLDESLFRIGLNYKF